MMQSKEHISVLRPMMAAALVSLALSAQAICQEGRVDRSVTAAVNRSVTFSAVQVTSSAAVSRAQIQTQYQSATSVSPQSSLPQSVVSASSPASALHSPFASSFRVSAGGDDTHVDSLGALGFMSSSSAKPRGTTGFRPPAKSLEVAPVPEDVSSPASGAMSAASGNMPFASLRQKAVFGSARHRAPVRGGSKLAKAQKSGTEQGCKPSSLTCTGDSANDAVWSALHPGHDLK